MKLVKGSHRYSLEEMHYKDQLEQLKRENIELKAALSIGDTDAHVNY
jgi:hypothetical protein